MRYRSNERLFEWIAAGYFAYIVVACWLPALPLARRIRLTTAASVAGAAVWAIAHAAPPLLRDWAPLAYILGGYFLGGHLFAAPSAAIESWLLGWDRRLLGDPASRFVAWPRAVVAALELIYMGCFLLIPAGLVIL